MLYEPSIQPRRSLLRGDSVALALCGLAGQALAADPPPQTPGAAPPQAQPPVKAADAPPHDAIDPSEQRPATTPKVDPPPPLPPPEPPVAQAPAAPPAAPAAPATPTPGSKP
ncbi:MAG: hypothetical protein U0165_19465, partial [Polyangiaceae bacterium]